jgi:SagB-type dehydrogenase family enzyme
VYRYRPAAHRLVRVAAGGRREALARAALDQPWVAAAPAVLVLTARYERTTSKYGERGRRYVHLEAGHAAQNVYLQAEARGLATVMVGAFRDPAVAEVLALEAERTLLALLPVGWPP